jgi:hypothetical protein
MKKFVLAIISTIIFAALAGCGTKRLVEAHILRDSVYLYRDSVILRYVKDSITEREKTTISTKRNELTGQDTIFVVREVWRDRWRMRADTIRKVEWRDRWRTKIDTREVTRTRSGIGDALMFIVGLLCVFGAYAVVSRLRR